MNKTGSALLIIVLICTILLTSLTVLWRSAALSYESAMINYQHKKRVYACESLIWYGIGLIKKELVPMAQIPTDQPYLIYQGNWPKTSQTWGILNVEYNHKNKQIHLSAKLFGSTHLAPISVLSVVCKQVDHKFIILNWQDF